MLNAVLAFVRRRSIRRARFAVKQSARQSSDAGLAEVVWRLLVQMAPRARMDRIVLAAVVLRGDVAKVLAMASARLVQVWATVT